MRRRDEGALWRKWKRCQQRAIAVPLVRGTEHVDCLVPGPQASAPPFALSLHLDESIYCAYNIEKTIPSTVTDRVPLASLGER